MTKRAYLPTKLISDKASAFVSHVIKEVAGVLGITIQHATLKHDQTIRLFERSHASIKQAFKITTGEQRSLWHKGVGIALLNYNTSYHTSIGCEPSRVFHGGNILDLNLRIRPQQAPIPLTNLPKMFLIKHRWSTKMFAEMLCKRTSNTKLITTKRPTLQDSENQNIYTSYSRKLIIKAAKILLRNFGGLVLTLLKKCFLLKFIWYSKLAPTRCKCFIACECVSSRPANPYLTYESRHKKGNLIRK